MVHGTHFFLIIIKDRILVLPTTQAGRMTPYIQKRPPGQYSITYFGDLAQHQSQSCISISHIYYKTCKQWPKLRHVYLEGIERTQMRY